MMTSRSRLALVSLVLGCSTRAPDPAGSAETDAAEAGEGDGGSLGPLGVDPSTAALRDELAPLSPVHWPATPSDETNRYVDDPRAAALGKQFFFDSRFSGPLLDEANNGNPGTLGVQGETGKVACASCHVPAGGYSDTRSSRGQISLGSGWSHRRALPLLDVGQRRLLNWDGRHDSAFSQVFTPIEDPGEFNSSRLFVAQQIARLYRADYEALFGPLPSMSDYAPVDARDAGCTTLPTTVVHGMCIKQGYDDAEVTRVVVNMGKAIEAYTRKIQCGQGRFDSWLHGQDDAMTPQEQQGAALFVGKAGCSQCHSGPFLTDLSFHNIGLHPDFTFFVVPIQDNGASEGLSAMLTDPLSSKGAYSDGYDGRLDEVTPGAPSLVGAFRTPSLRCVSRRPSFMHTGQFRSIEDVVNFFDQGGDSSGYPGQSQNVPRNLTSAERAALVSFLKTLDGSGPDPALATPPALPADP